MERKPLISIFTTMRRKLLYTARNITDEDSADDALQEAFCRLWTLQKIPDDEGQMERLAATTVKNISIDYQRRAARHPSTSLAKLPETADSSDSAETAERFQTVKRIIETNLNETQRHALWMRDYEDRSFADIAEELGMTEGNVRQTISRARKAVREIYRKNRE